MFEKKKKKLKITERTFNATYKHVAVGISRIVYIYVCCMYKGAVCI